jgi:CubicO group peptidase (beta-lactamase class C family)
MTGRIEAVLAEAREHRVFSAAAWSVGSALGSFERGMLGSTSWEGEPVGEDSRWDLASVTKAIVGLAVMSLVESGILTLDDTIAEHLPDYLGTDKARLTLRQLLTHTSGIPGQVPLYLEHPTRDALLTAIRELPLRSDPGTDVAYSSQGFIVLGLIAEAVTGQSLDRIVHDRVCAPVGMTGTTFGLPDSLRQIAVATENDPWRGQMVQGEVHDENAVVLGAPAGHAGLFSTLRDLESLGQALCANGAGRDGRLLAPATLRVMTTPMTDHLPLRRSLAWQGWDAVGSPAGDLIGPNGYGHTGFTGTSLWVDPDAGRFVVLLTNRVHPSRDGNGISRVRRLVHNIAFASQPVEPKKEES